jgi:hypothetical protein
LPSPFIGTADGVERVALGRQVRQQVAKALGPVIPAEGGVPNELTCW